MQVWSLDVDAAEQQVAVGGVSPQLQLYRIHSDSETGGASSASKQVRGPSLLLRVGSHDTRAAGSRAADWCRKRTMQKH